jgi:hypothetical protein
MHERSHGFNLAFALIISLLIGSPAKANATGAPPAGTSNVGPSAADQQRMAGLIDEMADADNRLLNIEIHFRMDEQVPAGTGVWQATGVHQYGTAWFDGRPASKGRISYDSRVMHREVGLGPDEECAVGYDGKQGRSVTYACKPGGNGLVHSVAEITSAASLELFGDRQTRIATGQEFSSAFYGSAKHGGLVQYLRDDLKDGVLTLSKEQIGGIQATRIAVGNPNRASEAWSFDEGRGMALLEYERVEQNVRVDHCSVRSLPRSRRECGIRRPPLTRPETAISSWSTWAFLL